eukprot:TCALIF_05833-PA protein Name:"Similar to CG7990 Post-GPI attachment to proteins factor 2-like (Drosophila melanogaster)" AED:0.06 eAED:0.06 QI:0/0.75/0.8/1/0.75/0.8/5/515/362
MNLLNKSLQPSLGDSLDCDIPTTHSPDLVTLNNPPGPNHHHPTHYANNHINVGMSLNSNCCQSNGNPKNARIWVRFSFRQLCQICLAMPLVGLVVCLLIAVIFQFEHIQETACKVFNVVPSISAITGISPGRYLWRIVIAFHIGPRLLIAYTYFQFLQGLVISFQSQKENYKTSSGTLSPSPSSSSSSSIDGSWGRGRILSKLVRGVFYAQLVEMVGLCGISFIHNREHYPTHEKGFILYLSSSHVLFLLVLTIYYLVWPHLNAGQQRSYYKKLYIFLFSTFSLFLMAYFYYRHIRHCDALAFSIFAFVEYFVAAANMAFYWTIVDDLPNEEVTVGRPSSTTSMSNGSNHLDGGDPITKKDN